MEIPFRELQHCNAATASADESLLSGFMLASGGPMLLCGGSMLGGGLLVMKMLVHDSGFCGSDECCQFSLAGIPDSLNRFKAI